MDWGVSELRPNMTFSGCEPRVSHDWIERYHRDGGRVPELVSVSSGIRRPHCDKCLSDDDGSSVGHCSMASHRCGSRDAGTREGSRLHAGSDQPEATLNSNPIGDDAQVRRTDTCAEVHEGPSQICHPLDQASS